MNPIYGLPYLIDFFDRGSGPLNDRGYAEVRTDKQIKEKIKELFSLSNLKRTKAVGVRQAFLKCEESSIREFISLIDQKSGNAISSYLKRFCIDAVYEHFSVYGEILHRDSQLWHHDSVGKRIKVFLSESTINDAPTLIEDGKRGGTFLRPMWSKDFREKYKPKNKIINTNTSIETVSIFDTNFVHKGSNGRAGSCRHLIMIELSNPLKKYCRGKVGPRSYL